MARINRYTDEEWERFETDICTEIGLGRSLKLICKREDLPSVGGVHYRLSKNAAFRDKMAEARIQQAETLIDQQLDLLDREQTPINTLPNGAWDSAHVNWVINKCKQLTTLAQILAPKKYGQLLKLVGDKDHSPVQMTDQEFMHRLQSYARRRKEVPSRN
jgi:hypothetical protein